MAINQENSVAVGKAISAFDRAAGVQMDDYIPFVRLGSTDLNSRNMRIEVFDLKAALGIGNWQGLTGDPLSNNAFATLWNSLQLNFDGVTGRLHDAVTIAEPANGLYLAGGQKLGINTASATVAGALTPGDWVKFDTKFGTLTNGPGTGELIITAAGSTLSQRRVRAGTNLAFVTDADGGLTINATGGSGTGITLADARNGLSWTANQGVTYTAGTGVFSVAATHLIPTTVAFNNKLDKLAVKPTAGTFPKISFNAEGQVTNGELLVIADIPQLTTAKVTGLDAAITNLTNSKLGTGLAQGAMWIGNVSGVATPVIPSGHWTITPAGVATLADVVTAGQGYRVSYDKHGRVTGSIATLGFADITTGNLEITRISPTGGTPGQVLTIVGNGVAWQNATTGNDTQTDGKRLYISVNQNVAGLVAGNIVRFDDALQLWVKGDASSEFNAARSVGIVTSVNPSVSQVEITLAGYIDMSGFPLAADTRYYLTQLAGVGILVTSGALSTVAGTIRKQMLITLTSTTGIFNPGEILFVPSAATTGTFTGSVNSLVRGNGTYTGTPSATGQVLTWNGTNLVWALPPAGTGGTGTITLQGAITGTSTTGTVTTALADNVVVTTKIANGAVTVPKLFATNAPAANLFYRGDGLWAIPGSATGGGTINLTGAVTGNGTGEIPTQLALNVVQAGNIVDGAVIGSKIANGSISLTKLATTAGTPSSTTFLRGDMTWQPVSTTGGTSFTPVNSLQYATGGTNLQLVGDLQTIPVSRYYGTNAQGARGFHPFPSGTATGNFVTLNGQNTGDTFLSGKVQAAELVATQVVSIIGASGAAHLSTAGGTGDYRVIFRQKGVSDETVAYVSDLNDLQTGGVVWPGGINRLILGSGAATPGASAASQVPTWNGSAIVWQIPAGGSGSLINTSLIGTTGAAPSWNTTAPITLNIPLAATAGVTAGLVSRAQVDNWNAKYSLPTGGTNSQYINGLGQLALPPAAPLTTLFYRPGTTTAGNSFGTWDLLYSNFQGTTGMVEIVIDSATATIPSGFGYDFQGRAVIRGSRGGIAGAQLSSTDPANPGQLDNCFYYQSVRLVSVKLNTPQTTAYYYFRDAGYSDVYFMDTAHVYAYNSEIRFNRKAAQAFTGGSLNLFAGCVLSYDAATDVSGANPAFAVNADSSTQFRDAIGSSISAAAWRTWLTGRIASASLNLIDAADRIGINPVSGMTLASNTVQDAIEWLYANRGTGGTGSGTAINTAVISTVGTAPAWVGPSPFTLSLPLASAAGVTAGLVSRTQVDGWNAKFTLPAGGNSRQYVSGAGTLLGMPFVTLIYRPGGVDSGNVSTTWAGLYAAFQETSGDVSIIVDGALQEPTIPATATTYEFQSRAKFFGKQNGISLKCASASGPFPRLKDAFVFDAVYLNNVVLEATPAPPFGPTYRFVHGGIQKVHFAQNSTIELDYGFAELYYNSAVVSEFFSLSIELRNRSQVTLDATGTTVPAGGGFVDLIADATTVFAGSATGAQFQASLQAKFPGALVSLVAEAQNTSVGFISGMSLTELTVQNAIKWLFDNRATGGGFSAQGSIVLAGSVLSLTNDQASPGANKVYGTDGNNIKGWYTPTASGLTLETVATFAAIAGSSTTRRFIEVTADETQGGAYTLYLHRGTELRRIGTTSVALPAVTPPAPTGGVVNDSANTFTFTPATGYAATDHESRYRTGGVYTAWTACTSNSIFVGNVAITAGDLEVRVMAAAGRNAGAVLTNATAFTTAALYRILIDVGEANVKTGGNWNNITDSAVGGVARNQGLGTSLVDTGGTIRSGIGFVVIESGQNGASVGVGTAGATAAVGDYPVSAVSDYFIIAGGGDQSGEYEFTGLPSGTYSVTLFGSRQGVSDKREGLFSVNGGTAILYETANNVSNRITFSDVVVTAGKIRIRGQVAPGSSNTYLNVVDLTRTS